MVPPYRPPEESPQRRRSKARVLALAAAVLATGGLATGWAMLGPDSYGDAATGCVHVALPSSTGGFIVDECGPSARAWCSGEEAGTGILAEKAKRACRDAGYGGTPLSGGTAISGP